MQISGEEGRLDLMLDGDEDAKGLQPGDEGAEIIPVGCFLQTVTVSTNQCRSTPEKGRELELLGTRRGEHLAEAAGIMHGLEMQAERLQGGCHALLISGQP